MSLTVTSSPDRTASKMKRASLYLSPTPSRTRRVSPPPRTRHSMKEIWGWTFKSDAIATCSVKDALEMEQNHLERMHVIFMKVQSMKDLQHNQILISFGWDRYRVGS